MASAIHLVASSDGCARRTRSEAGDATMGTMDDYAFFRSFVAEQAANDPELAAALAELQEPDPDANATTGQHVWDEVKQQVHAQTTQHVKPADSSQQLSAKPTAGSTPGPSAQTTAGDHAAGIMADSFCAGSALEKPQLVSAAHIKPRITGDTAAAAHPEAAAAAVNATPAAVAGRPAVNAQPSRGKLLRPDFTRREIRSLRRLFPMQSPTLKSAAMLQGEYQLLDLLGRGAFGAAYRARHLASGNLVCIKTVESTSAGSRGPADVETQKREVAVLAALKHPNIIRYHDCFSDGAKLHIVMEWADGGDLQGLISKHAKAGTRLPEEQLLTYFVQVVAALAHIHGAGVMHRDLKTSNILFSSAGVIKLADFGIAKVLDAPGANSSSGSRVSSSAGGRVSGSGAAASVAAALNSGPMAQSFVGTPNYLAPEMITCEPYNQKADVWACGCVLYEMAALRPAFKADRIPLVYRLIRRGRLPPLPSTYSPELKSLLQRLMAKDPNDRPSSAELLQEDFLRPHLERYQQLLQHLALELPPLPLPLRCTSSTAGHSACGAVSSTGARSSAASLDGTVPRDSQDSRTRKAELVAGPATTVGLAECDLVKQSLLQSDRQQPGPTALQTVADVDVDAEVQFLSFSIPAVHGDKATGLLKDSAECTPLREPNAHPSSKKYSGYATDGTAEMPGSSLINPLFATAACGPTQVLEAPQQPTGQQLHRYGRAKAAKYQGPGCFSGLYMCGCFSKVPKVRHSGSTNVERPEAESGDTWWPSASDVVVPKYQTLPASTNSGCKASHETLKLVSGPVPALESPPCPSEVAGSSGFCRVPYVAIVEEEIIVACEDDVAADQPVAATADTVLQPLQEQQITGQFMLPVGGLRQQHTLSTVVSVNESDLSSLAGQLSLEQLSEAANAAANGKIRRISSNSSLGSGALLVAKGAGATMCLPDRIPQVSAAKVADDKQFIVNTAGIQPCQAGPIDRYACAGIAAAATSNSRQQEEQLMMLSTVQEVRAAICAPFDAKSVSSKCEETPAHCGLQEPGPMNGPCIIELTMLQQEQLQMLFRIRQLQASLGTPKCCKGSTAPGPLSVFLPCGTTAA